MPESLTERVVAHGHEHVSATHQSTFELTTDDWLTPAGDCIVGIEADRAPASFDDAFVRRAQTGASMRVELLIGEPGDAAAALTPETAAVHASATGRGDPELTFTNDRSLVVRTSDYIDDRTVMIEADTAAAGLDRTAVDRLAAGAPLVCRLHVAAPADTRSTTEP